MLSPSLADLCQDCFAAVIVDEGTRMKGGETTEIATGVLQMNAPHRLVLTATPIKNRTPDVFWLAWWACGGQEEGHARWPYAITDKEEFAATFCVSERNLTRQEKEKRNGGKRRFVKLTPQVCNIHRIWKLMAPIILRRRKKDIGEQIVQKNRHVYRVPMGTRQARLYKSYLDWMPVDKNGMPAIGVRLQVLRMVAAAPNSTLLPLGHGPSYIPKLAAALTLIDQILRRGEQAIVFSPFHDPLDTLSVQVHDAGVRHFVLDGRTSQAQRGKIAAVFKQGQPGGIPILLAGIECMAEGHSFHLCNNEILLEFARAGADYLLEHAWDKRYGGWFDVLTEAGDLKETSKTVPLELYTDVGLTLYYFVTGERRVLARVKESVRIRQSRAKDSEFGGYFQALQRDLTVKDDSKSKHSHFGYASSLLVPLFLATRDAEVLRFAEELMQITRQRMIDPVQGWVRGFPASLDRKWELPLGPNGPKELVSPGAQRTAALVFLRLSEITKNDLYRKEGTRLAEQIIRAAWDSERGGWHDLIEREPPYSPPEPRRVSWWVQCYGAFVQLHLYHLTGENRYLERFKKMASFWNRHFLDKEFGGVLRTVAWDGTPIDTEKAVVWKASYHEMEFGLLNYLYLNLYVNRRPAKLRFHLRHARAGTKHLVSLVEDATIRISAVTVNGQPWFDYDAQERSVTLPEGDAVIVVTLSAP